MTTEESKLKRIEHEICMFAIEVGGAAMGTNFINRGWTDQQMKNFNNFLVDSRDRSLKKIEKIYKRRVKERK